MIKLVNLSVAFRSAQVNLVHDGFRSLLQDSILLSQDLAIVGLVDADEAVAEGLQLVGLSLALV